MCWSTLEHSDLLFKKSIVTHTHTHTYTHTTKQRSKGGLALGSSELCLLLIVPAHLPGGGPVVNHSAGVLVALEGKVGVAPVGAQALSERAGGGVGGWGCGEEGERAVQGESER